MAGYIEIQEAIRKMVEWSESQSTIEIVHCRDCKYSRDTGDYQDSYFCDNAHHNSQYLVHSLEYCSHGERI